MDPSRLPVVLPAAPHGAPPALPSPPANLAALLAAFLAGRTETTLRAYRADLEDFRAFTGAPTAEAAAALLLGNGQGRANELGLAYRADLLGRKLAPATVNRRLAAVRSLVKLARTLGLVPWVLEAPGVPSEKYRDTRGPGTAGVRSLLDQLAGREDPKARRDKALLRLLYDLGLRRKEAVGLDRADLDLAQGEVLVLGKGRREKARLSLPGPTREALAAWVAVRGEAPGPLFTPLDRRGRRLAGRLTGTGLYLVVRGLGERAGVKARPHGLRHAAVTAALDAGLDVRAVQRFSRHRDLRVLLRYDDNRADLGGDVARRLAEGL